MITINELNEGTAESFVRHLGEVFEHSPWVAEQVWELRPFASAAELHTRMMEQVYAAPESRVLALLRAHPDLATRLQVTEYSAQEQRGAGLDQLSGEEYEAFASMNAKYVSKFGFPFIKAVTGCTKDDIAQAMRQRIDHDLEREWSQALREIARITQFRLGRIFTDRSNEQKG
ncbi:2-oxo-4-hydroxy-4-carboxy-5-ureidoimidazoline decarboxylase [Paenibacillus rhizosphaerae]|uniref:2-oxo-4-hydroxy-4-carboxy-5-ureidoimidazoline decarboxylase n=1 Tax=Paenibacillus rhizosphaerae TaxID=297318 RepID=A0A839TN06_9BACL|nr:2-oxo-4-hydroxy-4-carboxy-5-ureidoimidazoline decarboxylase [Paenibacillus rhizosphaerae]MBB3127991.1 2-oxo-4-hydroxy-4-carboxy-5-ureidoimidazoline decarboxylase [Paenibacillus rhizosphaerae]